MTDYLKDLTAAVTITEDIMGVSNRNPNLTQVVSNALDGTVYIQSHGKIESQVTVSVILDAAQDSLLDTAYQNGHVVELSDDDRVYIGYIIGIKPSVAYVGEYHECSITIQEESV